MCFGLGGGGDVDDCCGGACVDVGVGDGIGTAFTTSDTPTCLDSLPILIASVAEYFRTESPVASAVTWIVWKVPG